MEWLKAHAVELLLGAVALWFVGGRLVWWFIPVKEDPTAPVRTFTGADFDAEVLRSPKPVLVDFWASWCMPCRAQGPEVEAVAKALSATAVVGKVDVQSESALASRFGINAIPALMVFKGGQVVTRFTGYTGRGDLERALRDAAGPR